MANKYFILFILFFTLLTSCKLMEKGETKSNIEAKTPQYLFQQLNDSAFRCNWFQGKLNATVDFQKKQNSFSAAVRLKKDSIMWVSISALGIEVVRVLITRDSLKLVNKLDATYMVTNYDYLDGLLQLNTSFELIQDLILGNYFDYVEIEKLNSSKVSKNNYVLETLSKKKLRKLGTEEKVTEEIWMDPVSYKVCKMNVDDSHSRRELTMEYNDFRRIENQMFPYKTAFLRNTKDPVKVSLEYTKVTVNKVQAFPFSIPANYKPHQ